MPKRIGQLATRKGHTIAGDVVTPARAQPSTVSLRHQRREFGMPRFRAGGLGPG